MMYPAGDVSRWPLQVIRRIKRPVVHAMHVRAVPASLLQIFRRGGCCILINVKAVILGHGEDTMFEQDLANGPAENLKLLDGVRADLKNAASRAIRTLCRLPLGPVWRPGPGYGLVLREPQALFGVRTQS